MQATEVKEGNSLISQPTTGLMADPAARLQPVLAANEAQAGLIPQGR